MTITRMIDNKEQLIELTDEELREASEQYDTICRTEDILGKIKEKLPSRLRVLHGLGIMEMLSKKLCLRMAMHRILRRVWCGALIIHLVVTTCTGIAFGILSSMLSMKNCTVPIIKRIK